MPDQISHEVARELDAIRAELGLTVTAILQGDGIIRGVERPHTVVAGGVLHGRPVVLKLLIPDEPAGEPAGEDAERCALREFWRQRRRHEISVYRMFAAAPPPIRVPALVHTDGGRLLVLEHVAGRPLGEIGRLHAQIEPAVARRVVDAVVALGGWRPPGAGLTRATDYERSIGLDFGAGYLTGAERDALLARLARCAGHWRVNHGDLHVGNLLLDDGGACAVLDWEFADLYLAGLDLARLRLTTPPGLAKALHDRIDELVTSSGIEDPYLVNLMLCLNNRLRGARDPLGDPGPPDLDFVHGLRAQVSAAL